MVSFECDYIAGAHPEILKRLAETNMESLPGYGMDHYTESAKEKIKAACGLTDAQVEFLVGGTQTNAVVISTMLRDWEGVIAADSGHVSVHESGAIEFTGHKVIELPSMDGKLEADTVRAYLEKFHSDVTNDHMVFPGMVYISFPTEPGTLYSKAELEALSCLCHEYEIPLYLDGARLGYGLMSDACDMTLKDIARLTDVFYIGGTKVGALCGEAVVFTKGNRPEHFMTSVKKRGALLAKGRLLGIQFDTLFTDDLYFKISRHIRRRFSRYLATFETLNTSTLHSPLHFLQCPPQQKRPAFTVIVRHFQRIFFNINVIWNNWFPFINDLNAPCDHKLSKIATESPFGWIILKFALDIEEVKHDINEKILLLCLREAIVTSLEPNQTPVLFIELLPGVFISFFYSF